MNPSILRVSRLGMAIYASVCFPSVFAAPPQQVTIDVKFVETTHDAAKKIGIDWAAASHQPAVKLSHSFTPMGSAPTVDVDRIIRILQQSGDAKIISAPEVTTVAGQPVAFSGGGVQLRVDPTVKPDGTIGLQLNPEVKEFVLPGNTGLFGRTLTGPAGGEYQQLIFMTPRLVGSTPTVVGPQVEIPIESAPGTEAVDWRGPYVGIETGYTRTGSDFALKLGGFWHDAPEDLVNDIEDEADHEFDEDTGEIGGLMGYNFQYGHWVFGGEIEGRDFFDTRDSFDSGDFFFGKTPYDVMSHFRTTYLVTATPRVGYAIGHALPYVRGGVAFGELDAEQKLFVDGEFVQRGRFHEIQPGWTVAAGLQYALTRYLSVRLEYQYTDLGSVNYSSEPSEKVMHFGGWNSASLTEHSANIAFIYNFGRFINPPPPPP